MRLLIAALLSATVSGRLGIQAGDTVEVPSYFGEAAVMPVNAASNTEAPEAPKLPILLTQGSLQTGGTSLKEENPQPVAPQAVVTQDGDLLKVCERTNKVLLAQAGGPAKPQGPVYKECMAALAPLRDAQQDSDAVDTLSDCMALVNALATKGVDCQNAVGVVEASRKPPPAPQSVAVPVAAPVAAAAVAAGKPSAAAKPSAQQEAEALDLVSEAMTTVCSETVRDAEIGIKSEKDAMTLANSIAPICQDSAQRHLGAAAAMAPLTKEWCHALDGRLTMALETGFFFALAPVEAERQAAEANPYASTTRRKFCARFVNSLRHQAQDGGFYLGGAPPPTAKPQPVAKPAPAMPLPPMPVAAVAAKAQLPTLPPAPKETPQPVVEAQPQPVVPAKAVDVEVGAPAEKAPSMVTPKGKGLDMLRLVQALSARNEWNEACTGLISRLSSEEGSVTEEYALGAHETPDGAKVLTFNAADQGQVRKCAAQLKVLAIQFNVLSALPSAATPKDGVSLISTGESLASADEAQALIDSPWAADACDDIAHGYLTARLAHPGLPPADYCPLYSKDLQAMHAPVAPAEQAKEDLQKLRKRGLKRRMVQAQAQALNVAPPQQAMAPPQQAAAPLAPATQAKPPSALITEAAITSNEEQEGMDFWNGLLKA
jgi:hypothetical protein